MRRTSALLCSLFATLTFAPSLHAATAKSARASARSSNADPIQPAVRNKLNQWLRQSQWQALVGNHHHLNSEQKSIAQSLLLRSEVYRAFTEYHATFGNEGGAVFLGTLESGAEVRLNDHVVRVNEKWWREVTEQDLRDISIPNWAGFEEHMILNLRSELGPEFEHASPSKVLSAANERVVAAKARLAELTNPEHPDAALLRRHLVETRTAERGKGATAQLAVRDKQRLLLTVDGQLQVEPEDNKYGEPTNANHKTMEQHGLTDRKAYDAMLARAIVARSGLKANRDAGNTLAAARAELVRQIDEAAALKQFLADPGAQRANPHLSVLTLMCLAMKARIELKPAQPKENTFALFWGTAEKETEPRLILRDANHRYFPAHFPATRHAGVLSIKDFESLAIKAANAADLAEIEPLEAWFFARR